MYEEGSQIRRSVKSIRSNIVEGYGRRRYKQEFIRFLTYAHASCDETIDHLETLHETGSLDDAALYVRLHETLDRLGGKLNLFIQSVEAQHLSATNQANMRSTRSNNKSRSLRSQRSEIPNPKLQSPNNTQAPIPNGQELNAYPLLWVLDF